MPPRCWPGAGYERALDHVFGYAVGLYVDQMIGSVAEQIRKLSEAFEPMPGDIVYSGTAENVGPVVRGDVIEGHIDGRPEIRVKVV